MRPLKILVIEYPRPTTRTIRFIDTLRSLGAEIAYTDVLNAPPIPELASSRRISVRRPSFIDRLRVWFGFYPRRTPGLPFIARARRGLPTWRSWWYRATAAIKGEQPDIYWCADLDTLPVGVWARRSAQEKTGVRALILFDMHELWVEQGGIAIDQISAWREISRRFIPEVDHLITVSDEFMVEVQREHGPLPATVIHSLAPDVEELQTEGAHAAYNIPPTAKIAVHIGTTAPNRNPDLGVLALQHLPDYYLVFGATKPVVQERLRSIAVSIGVEEHIRFTSNDAPRARLEALLATCNVNLILYGPSQSTKNQMLVLANKIFDGLAAGLPTVAAAGTASGAYLEREGLGITFTDDDPISLANAIRRAENPALHAVVRARRHEFHWSANRIAIARIIEMLTREQR